jgi:hypothetical protein
MSALAADLRLALDVDHFARCAGLEGELDPWQRRVLEGGDRKILLNCSRQSGKSTTAGLLACRTAIYEPGSLVLCVSPSLRQSGELFRKVTEVLHALPNKPQVHAESALRLELSNRSRVISLPGSEKTVRGYSKASLVILDEASRIEDALISGIRPMQAVAKGARFVAMSTPWGRRGFFFERWSSPDPGWLKVEVPATECPRISKEFLDEQRRELGPLLFDQEFMCEFVDDAEALFSSELVEAAIDATVRPLFGVAHAA